jgi:hypothetical protein
MGLFQTTDSACPGRRLVARGRPQGLVGRIWTADPSGKWAACDDEITI